MKKHLLILTMLASTINANLLHDAVEANSMWRIKLAVNTFGYDINSRNHSNRTPLHLAAKTGHTDLVMYLIDKGAYIHARDSSHRTPLHYAAELRNEENPLSKISIIEHLLRVGAHANVKDYFGNTPLHLVAAFSLNVQPEFRVRIAKLLIKWGADINAKNSLGQTPLHRTLDGDLPLAKYLVEAGADISITNKNGETVVDFAEKVIERIENGHEYLHIYRHPMRLKTARYIKSLV